MKPYANFLYNNFELLFNKEPLIDYPKKLEEKLSIVQDYEPITLPVQQQGVEFLKLKFENMRKGINTPKSNARTFLGGNITSLIYIKQYITNKITNIIPKN